jgi:hypothetical protein
MVVAGLLLGILGYGINGEDAGRLWVFTETVEGYAVGPEFRKVGMEYATVGSEGVKTTLLGMGAGKVLYHIRRLPVFSKRYAAKASLVSHYRHFAEGPLSAYLHLTGVQGVSDGVAMVEKMGRKGVVSDEQAKWFLGSFAVWPAISMDEKAVASVRGLVADVEGKTFAIREPVEERLRRWIGVIAREHGWATAPAEMSVEQQLVVLKELDGRIKEADEELWRTKQVSDFLCGVWGSTFGRTYGKVVRMVLAVRATGRVAVPGLGVAMGVIVYRGRRRGEGWRAQPASAPGKQEPS